MSPDLDDDLEEMAAAAVALRQQLDELLVGADGFAAVMALIGALGNLALQTAVDRESAGEFADSVAKDLQHYFDLRFDEGAEPPRSEFN